jgi:hypothetical protein
MATSRITATTAAAGSRIFFGGSFNAFWVFAALTGAPQLEQKGLSPTGLPQL